MKILRKVLFVNWQDLDNPLAGGAEVHLHETSRRLAAKGVECILYCHRYPGSPAREIRDGLQIHRVGPRALFNFVVWFRVRSWCRRHRPDVVVDDSNKIPFFLPWLVSQPVVVRIHHLFGRDIFKEAVWPVAMYVYGLERLASLSWKRTPVIAVSPSTRSELEALRVRRIVICYNGVDMQVYRPPKDGSQGGGPKEGLAYVGRLKKYKNLDDLLDVLKRVRGDFPHVRLTIAGTGDDLERLRSRAGDLGLQSSVTFAGHLQEDEKVKLYGSSKVVVNPSLKEGWGLTTIEANACGTCVVAYDVPGLRDSIRDGETGFTVPRKDTTALAQKVMLLLRDEPLRTRMEAGARKWSRKFSWDECAENTYQVLQTAIQEPPASKGGRPAGED